MGKDVYPVRDDDQDHKSGAGGFTGPLLEVVRTPERVVFRWSDELIRMARTTVVGVSVVGLVVGCVFMPWAGWGAPVAGLVVGLLAVRGTAEAVMRPERLVLEIGGVTRILPGVIWRGRRRARFDGNKGRVAIEVQEKNEALRQARKLSVVVVIGEARHVVWEAQDLMEALMVATEVERFFGFWKGGRQEAVPEFDAGASWEEAVALAERYMTLEMAELVLKQEAEDADAYAAEQGAEK